MASANPFASTSSATANGLAAPQTVSSPLADPTTSLWEALNLPVPESIASHHNSQRIVLLGRPLSGKRSLCRRLRLAAEAQNSATAGADGAAAGGVGLNGRAGGGGGGAGSGEYGDGDADSFTRRPLFHPTAEEEACADTGAGGEGDMGSPLMSSLMSEGMVERSTSPRAASTTPTAGGAATSASLGATGVGASGAAVAGGMRGMSGAMSTTSHGAGLVHDYVTLRVPSQARSAGLGGVQLSGGTTTTTTTNLFGRAVGAASRRVVEFFVCETAGALSMALPTLRSLEEAVVLVVVDVSRPAEIGDQLDRYYDMLQAHTTAVLRAALPHQDEVRRLQMMTARQQYWEAEEQRLLALRAHLAKDRNGEALVDPSVAFEAVNAAAVRLPQHATCPLDTLLVCTKVDLLDRLSKSYANRLSESASAPAGAGAIGEEEEAQLNHLLTPSLRAAMRQSKCTLLALVAQLLRQYAMLRRSALAAVSSRVNTIAGGGGSGGGGNGGGVGSELGKAGSALGRSSSSATTSTAVGVGPTMAVNPFFKALWAFVSCLLLSPPPSSSSSSSAAAAASGGRKEGSGAGGAGGGGRASSPVPSSPIGGASAVPLPDTVTHHCSANLYPSALLPHGLDSFGLLNPFVAAQSVTLPSAALPAAGGGGNGSAAAMTSTLPGQAAGAAFSAVPLLVEVTENGEAVPSSTFPVSNDASSVQPQRFPLHQMYLQQQYLAEEATSTLSACASWLQPAGVAGENSFASGTGPGAVGSTREGASLVTPHTAAAGSGGATARAASPKRSITAAAAAATGTGSGSAEDGLLWDSL